MSAQPHRSHESDPATAFLEKIRRSDRPVPLSRLKSKGLAPAECKAVLDRLAHEGRLHTWNSGKTTYVWHTSPDDHARAAALEAAGEMAAPRKELAAAVASRCFRLFRRPNCDAVLNKLLQSGELRELPKPGAATAKSKLVFAASDPNAYMRGLAASIADLIEKAEEAGASRDEFVKALGIPTRRKAGEPLTDRVYRAVERQQLSPGAHVPIGAVREDPDLFGISKSDFDSAVLRLADEQRIELAAHDDVYHLSEQQREMLVFEEPNRYYVAVATRRH